MTREVRGDVVLRGGRAGGTGTWRATGMTMDWIGVGDTKPRDVMPCGRRAGT